MAGGMAERLRSWEAAGGMRAARRMLEVVEAREGRRKVSWEGGLEGGEAALAAMEEHLYYGDL